MRVGRWVRRVSSRGLGSSNGRANRSDTARDASGSARRNREEACWASVVSDRAESIRIYARRGCCDEIAERKNPIACGQEGHYSTRNGKTHDEGVGGADAQEACRL